MRRFWRELFSAFCWSATGAFPAIANAPSSCAGKLVASIDTPKQLLALSWRGTIADPMSGCIKAEFDKSSAKVRRVVLNLDSEGGYIPATERAIATLGNIRQTHLLDTVVSRGRKCWSACVAVFLAGERRWGALTSTWLFHEVGAWAREGSDRNYRVDRRLSDRIFRDHFLQAGVSEAWLKRLYLLIPHSDYWQTGRDLWDDKSGIITHPIDNLVSRGTERRKY